MFTNQPAVRAWIYLINVALAVILAGITIWFQVTQGIRPPWLDFAGEALAALAAFFGFTAGSNTLDLDETALPAHIRRIAYYAAGVVGALVFLLSEYFRLTPGAEPLWLDAVNQILILIGTALSAMAASHVVPNPPPSDPAQPEGYARGGIVRRPVI